jgi:hypothetical protein
MSKKFDHIALIPRISLIATILVGSLSVSGCLIFIPGSVVGAVTDAITGDEGAHCVPASAYVGQRVNMPFGGSGVIKSLSGKSIRCHDPERPIRALIQ